MSLCYAGDEVTEGEIRLIGSKSWEGRVEIFLSGEWGTVCRNGAGTYDARVVCRQLGYNVYSKHSDQTLKECHCGIVHIAHTLLTNVLLQKLKCGFTLVWLSQPFLMFVRCVYMCPYCICTQD